MKSEKVVEVTEKCRRVVLGVVMRWWSGESYEMVE